MTSRDIVIGADVEYGLVVEGRGVSHQVSDCVEVVAAYPGPSHRVWDYRFESPRADLRGFNVARLNTDPIDAQFDGGGGSTNEQANCILPNGARFYSDHGHPEYASPECRSIWELAHHDWAGVLAVRKAAEAYANKKEQEVQVFRNNTDFHGAAYGSHENYLIPRKFSAEELARWLLPLMVTRQLICGAGKVGAESGSKVPFQLSQRAEFMTEVMNVDTLFRRPIFNTRDEPHADKSEWMRLHVICGDVNMMCSQTALKFGLMKLGLLLTYNGVAPEWKLEDPVAAIAQISRSPLKNSQVVLCDGFERSCNILRSYLDAAQKLELDVEMLWTVKEAHELLDLYAQEDLVALSKRCDWAAKWSLIQQIQEDADYASGSPELQAYDLAYCDCDPDEGLFYALEPEFAYQNPAEDQMRRLLKAPPQDTRALARGIATRFAETDACCWRAVTLQGETIDLKPDATYPAELNSATDVKTFRELIKL